MRAPLLAALLLAGCAVAPDPTATPTPLVSSSPPPSPSPAPSPSPSPSPSPPPVEPWIETRGMWTLEVEPGILAAPFGSEVAFVATLRRDGMAPDATFSWSSRWMPGPGRSTPIESPATRLDGSVFLGLDDRLGAALTFPDGPSVTFEGPPIRASGAERSIPFEARTDVSDDPPGLSVEVEGRTVRVTFAAVKNATTTADERITAATDLRVVRVDGRTEIVGFVWKAHSDAVAFLPEPERPRVIAGITDVPAGDVRVRFISRVTCFCFELPAPEVDEMIVRVD